MTLSPTGCALDLTGPTGFRYYVYTHAMADTGELFYIGKGSRKRAWSHARGAWWKRVVRKHGLRVQVVQYFETESEAFFFERQMIAVCRVRGEDLINCTDGGEGASGHVHSEASREKMCEAAKIWAADPALRRIRSESMRQCNPMDRAGAVEKLRASAVRSHADPVRKAAHREALLRAFENPEVRERVGRGVSRAYDDPAYKARQVARLSELTRARNCRPFVCVETGQVFEAMPDAAKWLQSQGVEKANRSGIQPALSGKNKSAYGYRWAYVNVIESKP